MRAFLLIGDGELVDAGNAGNALREVFGDFFDGRRGGLGIGRPGVDAWGNGVVVH